MNQAIAIGHSDLNRFDLFNTLTQRTAQFIQRLPYSKELRPAYLHIILAFHQAKQLDQAIAWAKRLEILAEKHNDLRALAEAIEHSWGPRFECGQLDDRAAFCPQSGLYACVGDKAGCCAAWGVSAGIFCCGRWISQNMRPGNLKWRELGHKAEIAGHGWVREWFG
jgi:hypothetical protein